MVLSVFIFTPNSILFWQKFHSLETSLNLKKTKVQKCEIGFKLILNRRERRIKLKYEFSSNTNIQDILYIFPFSYILYTTSKPPFHLSFVQSPLVFVSFIENTCTMNYVNAVQKFTLFISPVVTVRH